MDRYIKGAAAVTVDMAVRVDGRLSPNRGASPRTVKNLRRGIRDTAILCAQAARNELGIFDGGESVLVPGPVFIEWVVYWERGRNVWDEDNLRAAAGKGMTDGLVQARIIEDDNPGVLIDTHWEQVLWQDHRGPARVVAVVYPLERKLNDRHVEGVSRTGGVPANGRVTGPAASHRGGVSTGRRSASGRHRRGT